MRKSFNLVFDKWEGRMPLSNGIDYPEINSEIPYFILNDGRLNPRLFRLDEVTNDENFYYIITYRTDLSFLSKNNYMCVSDEVLDVCREKNLKIIFLNEHEVNVHELSVLKHLISEINRRGLKEENFYFINNNSKLEFYKRKLKSNINFFTIRFLFDFIISIMSKHEVEFKPDKEFLFLCHNRTAKPHRLMTLAYLKKYGVLDNTDYSFIGSTEYAKNIQLSFKKETYELFEEEVNFFKNGDNIISKYEQDKKDWFVDPDEYPAQERFEPNCYINSYINITTESIFNFKEVHISEKSFKPFFLLQLPIFVASYQHVQYMKQMYGLDMFDDLIDHSYDNEFNDDKRILKVLSEIRRLNNIKQDIIDFYKKNAHRIIANNVKIKELFKNQETLSLLKNISGVAEAPLLPNPLVENKKVLITGCNGLVGTYLVRQCIEKNYDVIGVDIADNIHNEGYDFTFLKLDLTCENTLRKLFDEVKPDVVLNAFGIKGSPIKAKESPVDFLHPSFKVNTELISLCHQRNIWLVFMSSVGVYAPAEKFVEDDVWKTLPGDADWFPSWSKRMGELLLEAYKVQYGYDKWAIIRPANIFGEFDDFSGKGTVIASTIKKVHEGYGRIEAWGDGTPVRDFVYAPDVASAVIDLFEKNLRGVVVNFGSGQQITIRSMIENVIAVSGKNLGVHWDTSKPNGDMNRKMDTQRQFELGLHPKTSFFDALNRTYKHYINSVK